MAEAVMLTEPIATPVTCGSVAGVVEPLAINAVDETVSVLGLLLESEIVRSTGAGAARLTFRAVDWPTATLAPVGRIMEPDNATVTAAVPD